jgi:hypothetical protein
MLKTAKQSETIPLFSCDGVRVDRISLARLAVLQELGRISRLVTHRKGYINGAFLTRLNSEPRPTTIRNYMGTPYGFRQRLSDGHVTFRLRALGDHPFGSERDLAPNCTRPIFLRVLLDCLQKPESAPCCAPRGSNPPRSSRRVCGQCGRKRGRLGSRSRFGILPEKTKRAVDLPPPSVLAAPAKPGLAAPRLAPPRLPCQ